MDIQAEVQIDIQAEVQIDFGLNAERGYETTPDCPITGLNASDLQVARRD